MLGKIDQWEQRRQELEVFVREHSGRLPSRAGETSDERSLGQWFNRQRMQLKNGSLHRRGLKEIFLSTADSLLTRAGVA